MAAASPFVSVLVAAVRPVQTRRRHPQGVARAQDRPQRRPPPVRVPRPPPQPPQAASRIRLLTLTVLKPAVRPPKRRRDRTRQPKVRRTFAFYQQTLALLCAKRVETALGRLMAQPDARRHQVRRLARRGLAAQKPEARRPAQAALARHRRRRQSGNSPFSARQTL